MRRAFAFLAITLVAACGAAPQPDRGDTAPSLAGAISSSSTTTATTLDVAAAAAAPQMVFDGPGSIISEFAIDLAANHVYRFVTTNVTAGTPVLHLLDSANHQVAIAMASGEGDVATLTFAPSAAGNYRLVVRARTNTSAGTCDLTLDGAPYQTGVVFAGWQIPLATLRAGETIDSLKLPNGAQGTQLVFLLSADSIAVRGYGNGIWGGGNVSVPSFLVGNGTALVGINRWAIPGTMRVVRNDGPLPGHDPDVDTLGTELESYVGTCSSLTGTATGLDGVAFDCSRATDARDTDGDGISDAWEVIGRKFPPNNDQPLVLWGADPRHKDLFVEVDFMQRSPGETETKMTAATARKFAAYYGATVGATTPARDAARAAVLRNPDGKAGIHAHLDTGVAPTDPADATIFGNWGGHDIIPPVQDAQGNWAGIDYHHAWESWLHASRRGIFRHSPDPASGGGSNSENYFSFSAGINEAWVLAHESGHAQGNGHSGPANITGVVDVNCKPNYPSMMNYAFQSRPNDFGFSDGLDGAPSLDNSALVEWQAVPPANTLLISILRTVFRYYVDPVNGHVDWNRDGEFAPAGTTTRAYANYTPSSNGCEFTRYNPMIAASAGATTRTPAIARIGNRTYVFWAAGNTIAYRWTTSTLACPVPSTAACGTFGGVGNVSIDASGGFDVVRTGSGTPRLELIANDSAGTLRETRLVLAGSIELWSTPTVVSTGEGVAGEPALASFASCDALLLYKTADGSLRQRRAGCDSSWAWSAPEPIVEPNGQPVVLAADASPAVIYGHLPSLTTTATAIGAFTLASDHRLYLYRPDDAGNWLRTHDLESAVFAQGRPTMAWVPNPGATDTPGRLYLVYRTFTGDAAKPGVYRWLWSYTHVTQDAAGNVISKTPTIGLDGYYDNVWSGGYGMDLMYEPGVDTNLRAAFAFVDGSVTLRPKADGILSFSYTNYDDWRVHRVGLCQQVVNPDGTNSNPIKCPVKDW